MQAPAKYMVIIEAEGSPQAVMFSAERQRMADFDASTEEVAVMTRRLTPTRGATGAEWDRALAGYSAKDRAAARVYTLDV